MERQQIRLGRGLGQWLLDCMLAHPTVSSLKKLMLATEDAHGLYEKYGFAAPGHPEWIMERYNTRAFETDPG